MDALYRQHFPFLSGVREKKTSDDDARYNCIAWAFGDNRRHWWPNTKRSYWPLNVVRKSNLAAFEELFAIDGWIETQNLDPEPGLQKIALYTLGGEPTHAARLLPNGKWTSKLGPDIDLSHELKDLHGPTYGAVYKVYCKPT